MKRKHSSTIEEQNKALQERASLEGEARMRVELLSRQKTEAETEMKASQEQLAALRRQVHELQQESADKEVKIVQLGKQRSQDKDDLQGLNIALDSKQQELELVSRSSTTILDR